MHYERCRLGNTFTKFIVMTYLLEIMLFQTCYFHFSFDLYLIIHQSYRIFMYKMNKAVIDVMNFAS